MKKLLFSVLLLAVTAPSFADQLPRYTIFQVDTGADGVRVIKLDTVTGKAWFLQRQEVKLQGKGRVYMTWIQVIDGEEIDKALAEEAKKPN